MNNAKPRLAVVSPFLDKRHGTERAVVEWLERLADTFEIHLYSQRVEDIDLSRIHWHRISRVPGPYILNYIWWFAWNHIRRKYDERFHRLAPDLVYSPGINCLDADLVSVHVVFAEFRRRNMEALRLKSHSPMAWPRLLHRRTYYRLICGLENRVYRNPKTQLVLYAKHSKNALAEFYGRTQNLDVVYLGLDHGIFNPRKRAQLRDVARRTLNLSPNQFVLLLVGNDLRSKGLPVILEAFDQLRDLPLYLLVAGADDPSPFRKLVNQRSLVDRALFVPPRKDVEFYYAAADAYVGPSKEDTFALPPAEAMACGLPIITSAANGTSEIITDGHDGLILQDASNAPDLAEKIRRLYDDVDFRKQLGENASQTMLQFTWERNGREMTEIFLRALQAKRSTSASDASRKT